MKYRGAGGEGRVSHATRDLQGLATLDPEQSSGLFRPTEFDAVHLVAELVRAGRVELPRVASPGPKPGASAIPPRPHS